MSVIQAMGVIDARIAKLKSLALRFKQLMDDPHPGLFTWIEAVASARDEINAVMDGKRDE